ncbi:MAG: hypothetical protein GYB65_17650 [Chloroflexi bacterium]|nr:hypothetical protein [Chloroflexota bacterium]
MAEQSTDNTAPRIVFAQRVIDKIVRGALLYPDPETGESMIGLVVPQVGHAEPAIYVLDTIAPAGDAVRTFGMFEQGDDWQADVFNWLHKNWEVFRELRRSSYGSALAGKWDVPLMYVGDWHKQPGDMIDPSGGDEQTARLIIADADHTTENVVAPIATMYPLVGQAPAADGAGEGDGTASAPDAAAEYMPPGFPHEGNEQVIMVKREEEGWLVRIDFWFMGKNDRRFTRATPVVWPDERLPQLPPVAWYLQHTKRFNQEYNLLIDAGYLVNMAEWDADGKPPYEICFSLYRPGSYHVIIVVTPAEYPKRQPAVRVAPLVRGEENVDMFEKLYAASEPVMTAQLPDWPWDSKRTLLELVLHVEGTLKKDKDTAS